MGKLDPPKDPSNESIRFPCGHWHPVGTGCTCPPKKQEPILPTTDPKKGK